MTNVQPNNNENTSINGGRGRDISEQGNLLCFIITV